SFATGESMDPAACSDPSACASPLGVLELGIHAPEWTANDAEPALAVLDRTAGVRGARADDEVSLHRCGARQVALPQGARPTAFRCCGGAAPELSYPDVGQHRNIRDLREDEARLRTILASVPELSRFAADFVPYGREDGLRALARGNATEVEGWEVAP